jgi:hypothetical protein
MPGGTGDGWYPDVAIPSLRPAVPGGAADPRPPEVRRVATGNDELVGDELAV